MAKGFIFRMLIMYAVMSYFRRPAATPEQQAAPGVTDPTTGLPKIPSLNLYENGDIFVS